MKIMFANTKLKPQPTDDLDLSKEGPKNGKLQ